MKKKRMVISIVLAVIAVSIIAWIANIYFNSPSYFLSKLPEKYKIYPSLKEKINSSHHEISPLFTGSRPKLVYCDTVNHVLVINTMDESNEENKNLILYMTYYRLDINGNLLDTLYESSDKPDFGNEFNGYLLYKNHYTNYLTTGSHEKHAFVETNNDLSMSNGELRALTTPMRLDADAIRVDYTVDGEPGKMVLIYSIKGKLHKVFASSTNNEINTDSKYQTKYNKVEPITTYSSETGLYDWKNKKSPIQIDYFLKEKYTGIIRPAFMSPAPITRPANWEGTGYFSIPFPNDTLSFKHPTYFYTGRGAGISQPYYENHQWGELDMFIIPGFNFQLLTVGYDNDHHHPLDGCYLVKPAHSEESGD